MYITFLRQNIFFISRFIFFTSIPLLWTIHPCFNMYLNILKAYFLFAGPGRSECGVYHLSIRYSLPSSQGTVCRSILFIPVYRYTCQLMYIQLGLPAIYRFYRYTVKKALVIWYSVETVRDTGVLENILIPFIPGFIPVITL